jgi:hypothetical protein
MRNRQFALGIHKDKNGFFVCKSEIIAGIRVPLDKAYALDIVGAISQINFWVAELHEFSAN